MERSLTLFTIAAFLNILFTYGMETSYFRFSSQEPEQKVYNTFSSSIIFSTILLTGLLWLLTDNYCWFSLNLPDHPEYILWVILIVAFDTLSVMPFAKLRLYRKAEKICRNKDPEHTYQCRAGDLFPCCLQK